MATPPVQPRLMWLAWLGLALAGLLAFLLAAFWLAVAVLGLRGQSAVGLAVLAIDLAVLAVLGLAFRAGLRQQFRSSLMLIGSLHALFCVLSVAQAFTDRF